MYKCIQHLEKSSAHFNYIDLITQSSNNAIKYICKNAKKSNVYTMCSSPSLSYILCYIEFIMHHLHRITFHLNHIPINYMISIRYIFLKQ
jgi:hypothetical protein